MNLLRRVGKGTGGLFIKMGTGIKQYVITLYGDYSTVMKEAAVDLRKTPLKGIAIGGIIGLVCYAIKTNPDEHDFKKSMMEDRLRLLQVSDILRNPVSEQYVHQMTDYFNLRLTRRSNLILFSIIWKADYSEGCDLYTAHCKQLKPKWREFHKKILDVGAFGRWYNLDRAMTDYDVNVNEFLKSTN